MGFKAKKKQYKLRFDDDTDLAGLEVTISSVSTGHLLRLQEVASGGEAVARDPQQFHELVSLFADAIVEWNLEDEDGTPVPATTDGILAQEPDLIMAVIKAWTVAIAGVSAPLDAGSTSGENSVEASMPMEPLSQSPSN